VALVKRALSVVGKLGIVIGIAIAFIAGLTGTVYFSLRSPEVKVPDVVGKDLTTAESALTDARLNMRKRATRYSPDAQPNMILDQSPRAGVVIKVGQTVAVVVSRAPEKDEATPAADADQANKSQANQNGNAVASEKNQNENQNRPKRNRNTNKNANNSNSANANNANKGNGSASNGNRNANNRNANSNANANRNLNANNRNSNANTNRNATNLNANRRPVISLPPAVNPNINRRIP
jgi:hypothetical protein